jgi:hypothetical protein
MPTATKSRKKKPSNDVFHLALIIDRSGSMGPYQHETIEGVNKYLDGQQRQPGKTLVTMVQFDTNYEVMCSEDDITDAFRLNMRNYQPRGMTALYDAVARTIADVDATLATMDEKPHVLIVVFTDGMENSSDEYAIRKGGQERIFKLVNDRQDQGWSVVYMGAHQDAYEAQSVSSQMGVYAGSTLSYSPSGQGVTGTYSTLGDATEKFRSVASATPGPATASASFFSDVGVAEVDEQGNAVPGDKKPDEKLAGPKKKLP